MFSQKSIYNCTLVWQCVFAREMEGETMLSIYGVLLTDAIAKREHRFNGYFCNCSMSFVLLLLREKLKGDNDF